MLRKVLRQLPFAVVVSVPFTLLIVLAVGLTYYLRYHNEQEAVRALMANINQEVVGRVNEHLDSYLAYPFKINQINLDAIRLGELNLNDPAFMEQYFLTQIRQFDSVVSISYANEEKMYVGATRRVLGRRLMVALSSEQTAYALQAYDAELNNELVASSPDYDPRLRPWYQIAVQAGKATWTPIFVWPSPSNDVGLDAVVPVYSQDHRLLGVLDASLTLNEIGVFLQSLNISEHGQVFVLDRSGSVIASSTIKEPFTRNGEEVVPFLAAQSPDPIMKAASQALEQKVGNLQNVSGELSLPLDRSGEQYTVNMTPYHDAYGLDWLIVTVIPQSDFMGMIKSANQETAVLILIFLLASLVLASLIAVWITRPITRLNQAARALAAGDWTRRLSLDRNDEIGELSASFDQMADRLRTSFETLRQGEELYRSIFENATIGMYRTTPDGQILMCNPALVEMLGYESFEDLIQRNVDKEGAEAGYERRRFRDVVEGHGEVRGLESTWTKRDGSIVFFRESARAYRNEAGQVLYYEGIVENVTARHQAGERIERQLERLAALNAIDEIIASSFDMEFSLESILGLITSQLGVDAADVLLLRPGSNMLEFGAGHGFLTRDIERVKMHVGEGYSGRVVLHRRPIHITDFKQQTDNPALAEFFTQEGFVSYSCLPLIVKGKIKGVIEIFNRAPLQPDSEWQAFLETLARQVAIAIDNAELFTSLQRSNYELRLAYDATIEGWSHAMDLRDKETEGHTQRVTEMTLKLCAKFGLGAEQLVNIRRGALLHDIGKMGVPDAILEKPGELTEQEWTVMRQHPTFAYDMLSHIDFLGSALEIPYCHHEKWDGSGYPRGLKGAQIPLAARIFAVIDVWDALRSDRPYRKHQTEEEALSYIRAQAGIHFDPEVVEAFLESIEGKPGERS